MYPGGSYHKAEYLLKRIPSHTIYTEPFGGSAQILFMKKPSEIEIYNDIDNEVVTFFRVLQDKELCEELKNLLENTPYARAFFEDARVRLKTMKAELSQVEIAYYFFVTNRLSYNAEGTYYRAGAAGATKGYQTTIRELNVFRNRFKDIRIENMDFRNFIKRYDGENVFMYLDPPYILSLVKNPLYKHNMSDEDHKDMVNLLLELKGKAILVCYDHDIYKPLTDNGWIKDIKEYVLLRGVSSTKNKRKYAYFRNFETSPITESLFGPREYQNEFD